MTALLAGGRAVGAHLPGLDLLTGRPQSLLKRPERAALLAIAGAWAFVVVAAGRQVTGPGPITALLSIAGLALMSTAVMAPAAVSAFRHVAYSSRRVRRDDVVLVSLMGYIAVWTTYSLVLVTVRASAVSAVPQLATSLPIAAFGIAAVWQVLPVKRRLLLACQRPWPIPVRGWRASAGALRFGTRYGLRCLASCWPLMTLMPLVAANELPWMVLAALLVGAERNVTTLRLAPRLLVLPLMLIGSILLVSAGPLSAGSPTLWWCRIL